MAYLDTIKAGAVSTWKTHRVLPSVVGAQAALESGWGTSKLAKPPYNNQFGIKASADWTGRTVNMPTREYISGAWITVNADFRAYDSAGDSVKDHGAFFTSTPWREENYKAVVGETDYKKACWALQNAPAPYATDTGYAQKLINLIENNNLQAWDREALADNSNTIATQTQQTVVSKMVGADLTDAGKQYVKDLNVTMIGDSLGVGTKPYFESLVPKANYDVLGSRQITHTTNSLNGTYILQQMKSAGTLKEYVVVILGTNRGVTEQEVNNFVSIAGDNHKVIFVDTASEVAHINTLSVYYQDAAKRLNNVYFANWRLKANSLKPQYYSKDGANGEYIHMTPLGYQKHAEFIAQALYEVATANFAERTASTPKADYYDIKTLELNEDGLITYDAWRVNSDGTSTKYKATKQTDIKGLHSPYGDPAIYNSTANSIWGSGGSVNHSDWIETIYQNNEETDMLELVQQAGKLLLERSEPSRIYTISLLDIPVELTIGDTGIFIDHEFTPPLYIEARVLAMTTSRTNPKLCKVTVGNVTELKAQDKSGVYAIMAQLGEVRRDLVKERIESEPIEMIVTTTNGFVLGDKVSETNLVARVIKGTLDVTEDYESFEWERVSGNEQSDTTYNQVLKDSVQSSVLTVMAKDIVGNQSKFVARAFNATGELISHQEIVIKRVETALWTDTSTPPSDAKDGSTWVDENGKHWILKDGEWEERVDQTQISSVRGEVEGAMAEAEQAKQDAIKAYEDSIAEAEALIATKNQEYEDIFVAIGQEVDDAKSTADSAVNQIDTAVQNAGFTTLSETIGNIGYIATGAEQSAQQATANASSAYGLAQDSISEAQDAQQKALDALGKADNALDGVSSLDLRVDDVEGEVALKADNSYLTEDGQIITLSHAITVNANRFSSDMQRIESRVESLAGEINLVILRGAIEGGILYGGEVFPNASLSSPYVDAMSELISVVGGESFALSKEHVGADDRWRINFYDENKTFISRFHPVVNTQDIMVAPSNAAFMWVSYPKGSKPQIVRGTTFVPYRPNLADQMTTDEVRIFRNEYDEFAEGTERRLTAIDSSGGSLDILSNKITTEAGKVRTDMTALINNKVDSDDFAEFYQNEYIETAQEVSRKISLTDVKPGNRNYLKNSGIAKMAGPNDANVGVWELAENIKDGEEVTLVWEGYSSGKSAVIFNWVGQHNAERAVTSGGPTEGTTIHYVTFKWKNPNNDVTRLMLNKNPASSTYNLGVQWVNLVKGNATSRNWMPAYEDTLEQIGHIETEWSQTFDAFSKTVSDIDGRVSNQKQTIDGLLTTVSDNDGKISAVEQTVQGLQQTVADKANQSEVTQLSNAYNVLVRNKPTSIVPNGDFSNGLTGWSFGTAISSTPITGTHIQPVLTANLDTTTSNVNRMWSSVALESGKTYKITFDAIGSVAGQSISVGQAFSNNMKRISLSRTVKSYEVIYQSDNDLSFSVFFHLAGTYSIGNFVVVESSAVAQSQLSILEDNINLRVTKGELISQINIEAGRTLIQSDKLILDADTVQFTGTAFIPSAVINGLEVNKLTGTVADFITLRSKIITADSIAADRLVAGTALVDKVFATSALIERLTSKTAFINSIKAIEISADKISGGTLTGTTFETTASNGFGIELTNGNLSFKRQMFTMAEMIATVDGATSQPNGVAIVQRPGHIFSINSLKNDGTLTSFPVIQIPADSTGENRKLNLNGDVTHAGGSFKIGGTLLPAYSYQSTPLLSEGGLRLAVDKASDGTRLYYLQAYTSAGAWVNSGFAWYEDGRLARVKNGVWTQF